MSTNGHVKAATWRPEDFAALEQLNEPVWVDIFEGARPPICIDARGYDQLVMEGKTVPEGNPLAQAAIAAYDDQLRAWGRGEVEDVVTAASKVRALEDKILAAICLDPPYCPFDALVDGRPPAGYLSFRAFTREQRQRLANFFYSGAEALKSVRVAARADEPAAGDGAGLPPAAEPDSDPTGAALPPMVAGRGDLAVEPPTDGARDFYARDARIGRA